jgi:uncharacterized CHY-type Zn-finger protein
VAHDFRDFAHLLRLAVIFALGLVAFVAARAMLVPDDFGVHGHFRAGALGDNRQRPLVHAGAEACGECHDDVVASRAGGGHESIGCEACHGPLAAHAAEPSDQAPELPDGGAICLRCHVAASAKPDGFPQVVPAEHAGDEACDTCHSPHAPRLEEG